MRSGPQITIADIFRPRGAGNTTAGSARPSGGNRAPQTGEQT